MIQIHQPPAADGISLDMNAGTLIHATGGSTDDGMIDEMLT